VKTMRAFRLHGLGDGRVETLPVPDPGPRELLVRVEACGICPTDVRKYQIGVNDGTLPFNPGHEWVGRVEALGDAVTGWSVGQRAFGDTYTGYAEYSVISVDPQPWSYGALHVDDGVPRDRAVFIEPLACALHALHDQARLREGERLVVVGAGQMGLQLAAAGAVAGASVHVIEPRLDRRDLALAIGAEAASGDPDWSTAVRDWSMGHGADVVVLSIGNPDLIDAAMRALATHGRLVLFAGFGNRGQATIDVNLLHYQEMTLIGTTAAGVPPREQWNRYEQARQLLTDGRLELESLVTGHCDLDGVLEAFEDVAAQRALKTVLLPGGLTP
jgi:L-iditol 2-dehydrogenase